MLSALSVVIPVFALIFAGWLCRRLGFLGATASSEMNRFVVYLALPALLFDIIAHAQWRDIWHPGFIAAFGGATLLVFALTLAVRLRRPRHLADAALDGLNASYANTGFLGFPLAATVLGKEALAPTLVATIITVCILFAVAIVLIEIGLQTETRRRHLVAKVFKALGKNPLVTAPLAGAAVPLLGLSIPASCETFLKLLGGAAAPCALVALGLFLAAQRQTTQQKQSGAVAVLLGFKLIAHPLLTWILAALVFKLPPLLTHSAVLLAALPTGTGPFMLAEFYRREAALTSRVVLLSTIISVITVSAYVGTLS